MTHPPNGGVKVTDCGAPHLHRVDGRWWSGYDESHRTVPLLSGEQIYATFTNPSPHTHHPLLR